MGELERVRYLSNVRFSTFFSGQEVVKEWEECGG